MAIVMILYIVIVAVAGSIWGLDAVKDFMSVHEMFKTVFYLPIALLGVLIIQLCVGKRKWFDDPLVVKGFYWSVICFSVGLPVLKGEVGSMADIWNYLLAGFCDCAAFYLVNDRVNKIRKAA